MTPAATLGHGPLPGRGKAPEIVTGTGVDEVAALRDLDDRLRERVAA